MNTSSFICSNPSENIITSEEWTVPEDQKTYGKITAGFVLCYLILGLPWNALVVITIVWKRLFEQPTILLLLNFVLNDIIMLLYPVPVIATTGILSNYNMGESDSIRCTVCQTGLIPIILMMNSLFTIALMTIDRFLYIYKPFLYEEKAKKKSTMIAILVLLLTTFCLCLTIGLLSLVPPAKMHFQPILLNCALNFNNDWYMILLIVTASIALIIIVFFNVWVAYIVLQTIRKVYKPTQTSESDQNENSIELNKSFKKKRQTKQLHLFRVFGGLIASNLITWLPMIILVVVNLIIGSENIHPAIFTATHVLFLSQIAVHPILETILIADVREPMKQIATFGLMKRKRKCNSYTEEETKYQCCIKVINSLLPRSRSSHTMSTNVSDNGHSAM